MKVTKVYAGDWVGFYKDGVLYTQSHNIDSIYLGPNDELEIIEIDVARLEKSNWLMPKKLEEL